MRKLRYGMIGGGPGSLIGEVHRKAANYHNLAEPVASVFSRDYEKNLKLAKKWEIDESRVYKDYKEMAQKESDREDKPDFIIIATPNVFHYDIAKLFLEKGFHIICDKPVTISLEEAEELRDIAMKKDLLFAVTYAYTGYSMVQQIRKMVLNGELGQIRYVSGRYIQDWMADTENIMDNEHANWRLNPEISGPSNSTGDIGTHLENLVSFTTDLKIKKISARLDKFGENIKLDNNVTMMIEFDNGAKGHYWISQIAIGNDNDLGIEIIGTKGSIKWHQNKANYLEYSKLNGPSQMVSRNSSLIYPEIKKDFLTEGGHPEGYIEAFARTYKNFINAIMRKDFDIDVPAGYYPEIDTGIKGVKFIEKAVESSKNNNKWIEFE
ncbi:MAG: Gfo/Idh/MocA family protein [Thermotogota bacterium]